MASVRPPSVKAFSVWPVAYRTMSAMAKDSGMATETISVPRKLCRNSRITSEMRINARKISVLRPWYEVLTKVD